MTKVGIPTDANIHPILKGLKNLANSIIDLYLTIVVVFLNYLAYPLVVIVLALLVYGFLTGTSPESNNIIATPLTGIEVLPISAAAGYTSSSHLSLPDGVTVTPVTVLVTSAVPVETTILEMVGEITEPAEEIPTPSSRPEDIIETEE